MLASATTIIQSWYFGGCCSVVFQVSKHPSLPVTAEQRFVVFAAGFSRSTSPRVSDHRNVSQLLPNISTASTKTTPCLNCRYRKRWREKKGGPKYKTTQCTLRFAASAPAHRLRKRPTTSNRMWQCSLKQQYKKYHSSDPAPAKAVHIMECFAFSDETARLYEFKGVAGHVLWGGFAFWPLPLPSLNTQHHPTLSVRNTAV